MLRGLYADAIARFWDTSAYEQVLEREANERAELLNHLEPEDFPEHD